MTTVPNSRTAGVLDKFLNPLRDVLTPDVAKSIEALRADDATQARIEDLANRHHESQLTEEELAEYDALIRGVTLIEILQAKARAVLKTHSAST
jgi:hypothetical protein